MRYPHWNGLSRATILHEGRLKPMLTLLLTPSMIEEISEKPLADCDENNDESTSQSSLLIERGIPKIRPWSDEGSVNA